MAGKKTCSVNHVNGNHQEGASVGLFDKGFDPLGEIQRAADSAGKAIGDAAGSVGKLIDDTANAAGSAAVDIAGKAGQVADGAVKSIQEGASSALENAGAQIRQAKEDRKGHEKNFTTIESLQPVVNVVNDAAMALDDKNRTIRESAIPEAMAGALGAGIGGVGSFMALYGLGSVGLSAAGITSGLAAAGGIVGGGMVAGVFVLAAPVAIAAGTGVAVASHLKNKQLDQEKERLYKEALAKHQAIIQALKEESDANAERLEYLQSLNVLLERAVRDLKGDLAIQDE